MPDRLNVVKDAIVAYARLADNSRGRMTPFDVWTVEMAAAVVAALDVSEAK
jgi:hypothetical protein